MGSHAAPAAVDLAWAALRNHDPSFQRFLVVPIASMGSAALPAGPLLQRLARTRSTWIGWHETRGELDEALATALMGLGLEVPAPAKEW
jgi:hypothetical protein